MFRNIFRKLFPDKTPTDFPGGYIPNRFIMDRVDGGPILVIGDYNGRDFTPLKKKFGEVYLLDISDNNLTGGKYFIQQSITEKIPFPDNFFRYVVLMNVLEHVWEDKQVLEEIRRVLGPEGGLLFCIPLYHDFHDKHYHIYSPTTAQIIFEHTGYSIAERKFMGTITSLPYGVTAAVAVILYSVFGQNALKKANEFLYAAQSLTWNSARLNKVINFRIFRKKFFSILIFAKKSEEKEEIDYIESQKKEYEKTSAS